MKILRETQILSINRNNAILHRYNEKKGAYLLFDVDRKVCDVDWAEDLGFDIRYLCPSFVEFKYFKIWNLTNLKDSYRFSCFLYHMYNNNSILSHPISPGKLRIKCPVRGCID